MAMRRLARVIVNQLKPRPRSLRVRVAAYLLVAALVPLCVLGVSSRLTQPALVRSSAQSNLIELAQAGGRLIENRLEEAYVQIRAIATNRIIASTSSSREEKEAELVTLGGFYKLFDDITLVDPKGVVMASSSYEYWGDWRGNRWYQEALQGDTVISDAFVIPQLNKAVVLFATPVRTPSGHLVGVLTGQFNMAHIWSIIDELRPGETGFAFLVNGTNTIIAHPDGEMVFRKVSAITMEELRMANSSGSVEYADLEGPLVIVGYSLIAPAHLPFQGRWRVAVAQPAEEAFAALKSAEVQFRTTLFVAVAIVAVAAFVLSQNVTRPLSKLVRVTREIAKGEYRRHGRVTRSDEIGELATAIDVMAGEIDMAQGEAQRRIAELSGLHEISQAFGSMTDVRQTFGELTKRMAQLIGCQICVIATHNDRAREMQAQPPGYGAPDELVRSFRYKVGGPGARDRRNFHLQGPLLAKDIAQIPDFLSQWVEGFGLFNLLIVPMAIEGRITGLVHAANKPGGFAEDDSKLLTIFASQAAIIIEKAHLFEETKRLAATDPLTGLWNRQTIGRRLWTEINRCKRSGQAVSILLVDIDKLKLFNDTYGHQVGDMVIKALASVLQGCCRDMDEIGRYGDDEFAVIMPDAGAEGAFSVARRILENLSKQPLATSEGGTVPISISIGGATCPTDARDADGLFSLADTAMYRVKVGGGSGYSSLAFPPERPPTVTPAAFDALQGLIITIDAKDHYTFKHSQEVTKYALWLAEALGMGEECRQALKVAGQLHDIGKIGIPTEILCKPGSLSDEEYDVICEHPRLGYMILQQLPQLEMVLDAVLHHHERWDGKGYPDGLKGEGILEIARILAIADTYSAMLTDRPYRKAFSEEEALAEIERCAGTQFDPELARLFVDLVRSGKGHNKASILEPTSCLKR